MKPALGGAFRWLCGALFMVWGVANAADAGSAIRRVDPVIYVVRRGWHIDVGFDAADLQPPLSALAAHFPDVKFVLFGFGDRRYLLDTHRRYPSMLAALWPGAGLILATGLRSTPEAAFGAEHVIRLMVSAAAAAAMQRFVETALPVISDADGRLAVEPYAPGPYKGSVFFATSLRYSAAYTCNTWAAEALQSAALPIHHRGVVLAGQLWSQVRRAQNHGPSAISQPSMPPSWPAHNY